MFNNEKQRFSLRKLSVGLASVCIGITFISVKQDTVKADTIDAKTNIVTAQSVNPDVQKADTQKELLKNTDTQDGVKQTEPIDKTSDSNTPRDLGTNGVAKENIAVSEQLENKENNVDNIDAKRQNELHVSTGDNQLNTTHENKQALETSLLKDTTKPETTNTFHVRKSNMQANVNALRESKAVVPNSNGGFDEATWGKLDVNNWQGSVQDGVYELTKYTGDPLHIIVPNVADFEQAGKSTNGLQVGITSDTARSIFSFSKSARTIAFSKTSNQKVKAIGTDWSYVFSVDNAHLSKFDGSNLDVSNITDMSGMFNGMSFNFFNDKVSDLTSLSNWDTSKVTNMSEMFNDNSISDLTPLANWDVSNVTNMRRMFISNKVSDLTPLSHWNTSKVTDMNSIFYDNEVSDLTPLSHWNTSNVTDMSEMFTRNKVSDLTPLANWDTSNVTDMSDMLGVNKVSDLTPLANWKTSKVTNMNSMLANNQISNLTPLVNWDTSKVTNMEYMFAGNQISDLTSMANWDTSKVTDMSEMFTSNKVSDLTPLANWDTSNVTDMSNMFRGNKVSDLTPLANWKTSKVTNMNGMLANNQISYLTSLAHWNTSKVTDMSTMFASNQISNLAPLANWDTSKVVVMMGMFASNPDLIDLKPIANWNISSAKPWGFSGIFKDDTKLNLTNINNTPLMQVFLKMPKELQGSTFITNNADFVKAITGQDLPTLTNTAKRTIVFHFPNGTHETVNQIINYKALAPVQIDWPIQKGSVIIGGGGFSSGTGSSVVVGGHGSSSGAAGGSAGGASGSGSFSGGGSNVIINEKMRMAFASFARVGAPVQTGSDGPKIIKTYSAEDVNESDWQLDDSKPNDDVIIDGVICFKPVKIPHVNGYKAYLMKDPVNPAMFLVSFVALPKQLQNNQLNNVQLPQKPAQPEQKQSEQKQPEQKQPEQKQSEQKQSEQKQPEQKQPEQKQSEQKQSVQKPAQPIQTRSADAKQVDQAINHSSYTLMHNDSTFDDVNNFEPVQDDSASLEASSDSTQKDDAAKIVNVAKPKKHIVKKHVVKRHKKHAKKYHLKRRSRKHTKRVKKRIIKHRKRASRKFRKHGLKKHIKKA